MKSAKPFLRVLPKHLTCFSVICLAVLSAASAQAQTAIGATWAATDGCSELTCWLIEYHQHKPDGQPVNRQEELLALLYWADSRN